MTHWTEAIPAPRPTQQTQPCASFVLTSKHVVLETTGSQLSDVCETVQKEGSAVFHFKLQLQGAPRKAS